MQIEIWKIKFKITKASSTVVPHDQEDLEKSFVVWEQFSVNEKCGLFFFLLREKNITLNNNN